MVQTAAGEAVGRNIGPLGLMPHDVGGVQAQVRVADADAVAAEGAGVAVGLQYFMTEIGDAAAPGFRFQIEADGGENVFVDGRREVGGQQGVRDLADQERIAAEGFVDGRGEAAFDGVAKQFAL